MNEAQKTELESLAAARAETEYDRDEPSHPSWFINSVLRKHLELGLPQTDEAVEATMKVAEAAFQRRWQELSGGSAYVEPSEEGRLLDLERKGW